MMQTCLFALALALACGHACATSPQEATILKRRCRTRPTAAAAPSWLDAWSFLISGKKKLQIMGDKTLDPAAIKNQADYDAQLAGYKGSKGMDGAFGERPGFFKALVGGKPIYYMVESKATAGVYPAVPARSILDMTKNGGGRQMRETWLNSQNGKRIPDSVGNQELTDIRAAAADGRVKKVLALTDKNGTRYFEINDVPNQPGEVSIGADITSLFK